MKKLDLSLKHIHFVLDDKRYIIEFRCGILKGVRDVSVSVGPAKSQVSSVVKCKDVNTFPPLHKLVKEMFTLTMQAIRTL